ncbi:MAG TPA: hypothetical protein VG722_09265, partial [Tepidisphaeraceae bacterium]|nr:hypothetical protein [Tepidisphaeraceae bacterium]
MGRTAWNGGKLSRIGITLIRLTFSSNATAILTYNSSESGGPRERHPQTHARKAVPNVYMKS